LCCSTAAEAVPQLGLPRLARSVDEMQIHPPSNAENEGEIFAEFGKRLKITGVTRAKGQDRTAAG